MLKGLGVGAATAWVAPVVMSSTSFAAGGAGSGPPVCKTVFVCGTFTLCSFHCPNAFGDNLGFCFQRVDGVTGTCLGDFACATPACNTNSDCAHGHVCVTNTCCGHGVKRCTNVCGHLDGRQGARTVPPGTQYGSGRVA
jgi:hypothetical protein